MLPTDALALVFGSGARKRQPFTAATWPRTPPESDQPSLVALLRQALIPGHGAGHVGVSVTGGKPSGYVMLGPRAGGLVWDVAHLSALREDDAVELARWAQDCALRQGGRRVMLETPDAGRAPDVARLAGFEQYATGATYRLDPGFARTADDAMPARPRFRADEIGLFQLYSAAVPAPVRVAEAMTQEEWAALYPGRKAWAPVIFNSTKNDYVWEMGSRTVAWMRVTYGQRSQALDLLIHPTYEAYADRMLQYALTQMSAKVPVLSDVREYQGAVRAALERAGFRPGPGYQAWYRTLASRVPEPGLATLQAPVSPG
jgi:hypothetical protein